MHRFASGWWGSSAGLLTFLNQVVPYLQEQVQAIRNAHQKAMESISDIALSNVRLIDELVLDLSKPEAKLKPMEIIRERVEMLKLYEGLELESCLAATKDKHKLFELLLEKTDSKKWQQFNVGKDEKFSERQELFTNHFGPLEIDSDASKIMERKCLVESIYRRAHGRKLLADDIKGALSTVAIQDSTIKQKALIKTLLMDKNLMLQEKARFLENDKEEQEKTKDFYAYFQAKFLAPLIFISKQKASNKEGQAKQAENEFIELVKLSSTNILQTPIEEILRFQTGEEQETHEQKIFEELKATKQAVAELITSIQPITEDTLRELTTLTDLQRKELLEKTKKAPQELTEKDIEYINEALKDVLDKQWKEAEKQIEQIKRKIAKLKTIDQNDIKKEELEKLTGFTEEERKTILKYVKLAPSERHASRRKNGLTEAEIKLIDEYSQKDIPDLLNEDYRCSVENLVSQLRNLYQRSTKKVSKKEIMALPSLSKDTIEIIQGKIACPNQKLSAAQIKKVQADLQKLPLTMDAFKEARRLQELKVQQIFTGKITCTLESFDNLLGQLNPTEKQKDQLKFKFKATCYENNKQEREERIDKCLKNVVSPRVFLEQLLIEEDPSEIWLSQEPKFSQLVEQAGYLYDDKFEKLYKKINGKRHIKPSYEELRRDFLVSTTKLDEVLIRIQQGDINSTTGLAAEYWLEEVGVTAEQIAERYPQEKTESLAVSTRNFYLLGLYRKAMAHQSILMDFAVLNYLIEQQSLETKVLLKQAPINSQLPSGQSFKKSRNLSYEDLKKYQVEMTAYVEGYGFNADFKILGRLSGNNIGVQGDLNILVQPSNVSQVTPFHESELELALSDLLNADVRVYTQRTLEQRWKSKVTTQHIATIVAQSYTLVSYLQREEYKKIFQQQRYASFMHAGQRIDISQLRLRAEFQELFSYLFDKTTFGIDDLRQVLANPTTLQQAIIDKINAYNAAKDEHAEQLLNFLTKLKRRLIDPFVMKYVATPLKIELLDGTIITHDPIRVSETVAAPPLLPMQYPRFIREGTEEQKRRYKDIEQEYIRFTMQEYWAWLEQGHFTNSRDHQAFLLDKQQGHIQFQVSSHGTILAEDGHEFIIQLGNNFVKISKEEFDSLYIKMDDTLGGYQNYSMELITKFSQLQGKREFNHSDGVAAYITHIFSCRQNKLIELSLLSNKSDEEAFAEATSIDYVYSQAMLNKQREETRVFREKRLQANPIIKEIIRKKANGYAASMKIAAKSIIPNMTQPMLKLITVEKQLDELLADYYYQHEEELTREYQSLDIQQKQIVNFYINQGNYVKYISCLPIFQRAAKAYPELIKEEQYKQQVMHILEQRKRLLIELMDKILDKVSPIISSVLADKYKPEKEFEELYQEYCGGSNLRDGDMRRERAYTVLIEFAYVRKLFKDASSEVILAYINNDSNLEEKVFCFFSQKYLTRDQISQEGISHHGPRAQMVDFPSEVEFAFKEEMKRVETGLIQRCNKENLPKTFSKVINGRVNVDSNSNKSTYPYQIPAISNGILGYNSELSLELPIIHQRAALRDKALPTYNKPSDTIDSWPMFVKDKTPIISINYRGETRGTFSFTTNVQSLKDLLTFHSWTVQEKKEYQGYEKDNKLITEYYEFRRLFDNLKTEANRGKKYLQKIEEYTALIQQSNVETMEVEADEVSNLRKIKLQFFQQVYESNLQKQDQLIKQIMQLPFTQKRMRALLKHPMVLKPMVDDVASKKPKMQVRRTEELVAQAINAIYAKTKQELLETTGVDLAKRRHYTFDEPSADTQQQSQPSSVGLLAAQGTFKARNTSGSSLRNPLIFDESNVTKKLNKVSSGINVLTDPTSRTQFDRHAVDDDGDCGYTAFGITRQKAYQKLRDNLNQVRTLLQPVIKESLLTESFIQYLEDNELATSGLLTAFRRYQQNTNVDATIAQLYHYADDLAILTAYVDYDIRDKKIEAGWSHPAILQALAHVQGIELYIWRLSTNQQVMPHGYYPHYSSGQVSKRIDLLFVNGNHFERLERLVPHPSQQTLSKNEGIREGSSMIAQVEDEAKQDDLPPKPTGV